MRTSRSVIFSTFCLVALGLAVAPAAVHAASFTITQSFQKTTRLAEDSLGNAVAAVGPNVLVGDSNDGVWGPGAGAAYLFDATNGALLKSFKATNPAAYDAFGYSVAAFGTNVLVGALYDDTAATDAGAVYLFDAGTAAAIRVFVSPSPSSSEQFGFAITSIGNTIIVGAPGGTVVGGPPGGIVYAFDSTNGNLLWGQIGTGQDGFGSSVAAIGSNLLVGAPFDDTGANGAGKAYLLDGATGAILQTFLNPTPASGESFGHSVAAVGANALIGAPFHGTTSAPASGAAYLFDADTADLLHTFLNPTPAAQEWFGSAVAAWGPEGLLIAAAYDSTAAPNAGAVYLYEPTATSWAGTFTFKKTTPVDQDQLGASIATLGLDVIVGVTGDDTGAEDAGMVLLFGKAPVCGDALLDPGEACDDGNAVNGDCCDATCTTAIDENMPCSDGSACTSNDTCHSGVCQGTNNCDDGSPCTTDTCANKISGLCRHRSVTDSSNTACASDNNLCTFDVCRAGTCSHPPACDDGNDCTQNICNPTTGVCSYAANPDTVPAAPCDDHNACTLNTTCSQGVCGSGSPKCDDRLPCQTGACVNTINGVCRYIKVKDDTNTPCASDGDTCTNDVCRSGACAHPSKCDDGNDCTSDMCNAANGMCSHGSVGDGIACDDHNACTLNTTCSQGTCQNGTPKCNDRLPCQTGVCANTTSGACRYTKVSDASNVACGSDGNNCTLDVCRGGTCTHPPTCSDGNDCTTDTCNAADGSCSYPPKTDGTSCDDYNACTVNTSCYQGACLNGSPKCDDRVPCQTGVCLNTTTGACRYTKVSDASNVTCGSDGNNCTLDVCRNGACAHPPTCSDGNDCTYDNCNPADGSCAYPVKTDGTVCDDFNGCTLNTTCSQGMCLNGSPKCDDRLPCQSGECTNTTTGACRYTKVRDDSNTACASDGSNCTDDLCRNGACAHITRCVDGNDCTYDNCNPADGSCANPVKTDGTVCDDFNACTVNTTCSTGQCVNGTAKCDDRLPCQSGECTNTTTGHCKYTNANGAACNDNDGCTLNDACLNGSCQGAFKDCGDANLCTQDICVSPAGTCTHPPEANGTVCSDDGNQCTNDVCDAGICEHYNKLNGVPCEDNNACSPASVCVNGACAAQGCNVGVSCGGCGGTCQDSPCGCR